MPGRRDIPERPHRKRTRNPDCARYVSGGVAHFHGGLLFGLPFFCGGLLCLATLVSGLLGISEGQTNGTLSNWIVGVDKDVEDKDAMAAIIAERAAKVRSGGFVAHDWRDTIAEMKDSLQERQRPNNGWQFTAPTQIPLRHNPQLFWP